MSRVFLVSDTHFGHSGVCKFLRDDGTKLRPWDDPKVMDADMIIRWNAAVAPEDVVYHLGDVVLNRRSIDIMAALNGTKILIKGNHDTLSIDEYLRYFTDVRGSYELDNYLLTHFPVYSDSFSKKRYRGNIHGHTHNRNIGDPWYQSACVELTDYAPILFDEFVKRFDNTDNVQGQ